MHRRSALVKARRSCDTLQPSATMLREVTATAAMKHPMHDRDTWREWPGPVDRRRPHGQGGAAVYSPASCPEVARRLRRPRGGRHHLCGRSAAARAGQELRPQRHADRRRGRPMRRSRWRRLAARACSGAASATIRPATALPRSWRPGGSSSSAIRQVAGVGSPLSTVLVDASGERQIVGRCASRPRRRRSSAPATVGARASPTGRRSNE